MGKLGQAGNGEFTHCASNPASSIAPTSTSRVTRSGS
jgi:hypothetical protein